MHIIKPTASSLADALTPRSIQYLRKETLGDILLKSNLTHATSCIILDRTQGFLTGAVAERAHGRIVSVLDLKIAAVALADPQLMAFLKEKKAFQHEQQLLAAIAKCDKAKRVREKEDGSEDINICEEGFNKKMLKTSNLGSEEETAISSVEAADESMAQNKNYIKNGVYGTNEIYRVAIEKLREMKVGKDKRHKNNNYLVLNRGAERGEEEGSKCCRAVGGRSMFFVRHSSVENVVELDGTFFDFLAFLMSYWGILKF